MFYKMQGISLLAEDLLASQDKLCSMELVIYMGDLVGLEELNKNCRQD